MNKVVYFHINPLTNKVFYVGIGNKQRAYYKKKRKNQFWHNIVNKYGYIVDIVHENLTIGEAKTLEIFYINKIGRRDLGKGTLVNLTNGGEGTIGYKHSEESKKKISQASKINNMGREVTDVARVNMSVSHRGKTSGMKGKKLSEEQKEKKRKASSRPNRELIKKYLKKGLTQTGIANLLNLTQPTISAIIKRFNLTINN